MKHFSRHQISETKDGQWQEIDKVDESKKSQPTPRTKDTELKSPQRPRQLEFTGGKRTQETAEGPF